MNGRKKFMELINDKQKLNKMLNVSNDYIDLCERYGCSGIWTKKDVNNEIMDNRQSTIVSKQDNIIYVDFVSRSKKTK